MRLHRPKILGIIPARGGSKGLPGKNIKNLRGKPLIAYTIEATRKSKYIDRCIVSTDDDFIREVAIQYDAETPFLRPKEIAQDNTPTIDVIIHCLDYLKQAEEYEPDYVCILQCTVPFRTTEDIDNCIEKCLTTEFDECISVCEAKSNPQWMKKFKEEKLCAFMEQEDFSLRRQDLPKVYELNGAVYVIRTKALLKHHSLHLTNTTGYVMPEERSIDIDTPLDFLVAEAIADFMSKK